MLFCLSLTIDKIMTGDGIQQQDLVISKLFWQDISKYKSLFPHVSAAIQLSNSTGKYPMKGDTIQYIYTNSQHNNPLCRVGPIAIGNAQAASLCQYDKENIEKWYLMLQKQSQGFLDLIGLFIVVIPEIRKEEGNGMMPKDASQ